MGAEPLTAQSIVCFLRKEDHAILDLMLKGSNEVLKEAGVALTGGHSIYDETVKLGFSVMGTSNTIWKNNSIQADNLVYMTKPIGTGITCANIDTYNLSDEDLADIYNSMTTLNKYHYDVMKNFEITACTDITGFGLLGHLSEMMIDNEFGIELELDKVPMFDIATTIIDDELTTYSIEQNRLYLENLVIGKHYPLLYDAQTSGGLLFTIDKNQQEALEKAFKDQNLNYYLIGHVTKTKIIEVK